MGYRFLALVLYTAVLVSGSGCTIETGRQNPSSSPSPIKAIDEMQCPQAEKPEGEGNRQSKNAVLIWTRQSMSLDYLYGFPNEANPGDGKPAVFNVPANGPDRANFDLEATIRNMNRFGELEERLEITKNEATDPCIQEIAQVDLNYVEEIMAGDWPVDHEGQEEAANQRNASKDWVMARNEVIEENT